MPENTSGSDDSLPAPIAEPPCNPKQNGEEDIQELPARTPADIQKLQGYLGCFTCGCKIFDIQLYGCHKVVTSTVMVPTEGCLTNTLKVNCYKSHLHYY